MNYSSIRKRLSFANVIAVLALFVALGGASYAAVKINGKTIKKQSIAGNRLKADTIDGSRINESKLGEVPSAARAGSAGSADTAGRAESAAVADSATSAGTASNADNAANASALGGQSAAQLRSSTQTASGTGCDPTGLNNPSCVASSINLPATSDVYVIGSGGWYGTAAGDDKGECFISVDPNVNAPSGIRMEVGQTDATHDDFDTAGEVVVHTTIQDVPAGNQTFRMRCFEEAGDFKVENTLLTVMRLPS